MLASQEVAYPVFNRLLRDRAADVETLDVELHFESVDGRCAILEEAREGAALDIGRHARLRAGGPRLRSVRGGVQRGRQCRAWSTHRSDKGCQALRYESASTRDLEAGSVVVDEIHDSRPNV